VRRIWIALLTAFVWSLFFATGASADRSKVSRTTVAAMEESLDKRLAGLFPEDPVIMVGVTKGTYIAGFGTVFMGELNLVPAAGITPFHQTVSKEEIARTRQKEIDRVPKLRQVMQELLLSSAASLDAVPAEEQIALSITLFHFHWENIAGVPSQIVMHAPKKTLVAVHSGRADRSLLASSILVEEF
jgi:hypothetical protein